MKKIYLRVVLFYRAMRISRIARDSFNRASYSCANVSRVNRSLAFVIDRITAFDFPQIQQIKRPDNVVITEKSNCVVVKDGSIYELSTWL